MFPAGIYKLGKINLDVDANQKNCLFLNLDVDAKQGKLSIYKNNENSHFYGTAQILHQKLESLEKNLIKCIHSKVFL